MAVSETPGRGNGNILSKLTFGTKGTKSSKIKLTSRVASMLIPTIGTMFTETPRIPQTLPPLTVGVHMKVEAFGITAFAVLGKEPALGHLFQVVLVQEFTCIAFLAKTPKPMFADN